MRLALQQSLPLRLATALHRRPFCPLAVARHWSFHPHSYPYGTGRQSGAASSGRGLGSLDSRGPTHGAHRPPTARAAAGSGAAGTSTSTNGFWTLESYVLFEMEVKKSKFVVHAWPVATAAEALARVKEASDPAASHNCWAYRVGQEFRSSDDGEPSGTAGKPIQTALDGEGLDRVCVLVIRYYGGIKLGAGGLVRAYGGAAKECLKLAPRTFAKAKVTVRVEAAYEELGTVYGCLDQHGCVRLDEQYGSGGTVTIVAVVDEDKLGALQTGVADGTAGRRRVEVAAEADVAAG